MEVLRCSFAMVLVDFNHSIYWWSGDVSQRLPTRFVLHKNRSVFLIALGRFESMVFVYVMIHFCLFYSTFGRMEDALESTFGWITHFAQVAPLQRVADTRTSRIFKQHGITNRIFQCEATHLFGLALEKPIFTSNQKFGFVALEGYVFSVARTRD